jgi:hypothetical protein
MDNLVKGWKPETEEENGKGCVLCGTANNKGLNILTFSIVCK